MRYKVGKTAHVLDIERLAALGVLPANTKGLALFEGDDDSSIELCRCVDGDPPNGYPRDNFKLVLKKYV